MRGRHRTELDEIFRGPDKLYRPAVAAGSGWNSRVNDDGPGAPLGVYHIDVSVAGTQALRNGVGNLTTRRVQQAKEDQRRIRGANHRLKRDGGIQMLHPARYLESLRYER